METPFAGYQRPLLAVGLFCAGFLLPLRGSDVVVHQIDLHLEEPEVLPAVSVPAEVSEPTLNPASTPQGARRIFLELTPMENGMSCEVAWLSGEELFRVRVPVALATIPPVVNLSCEGGPQIVDAVVMPAAAADASLTSQLSIGGHIVSGRPGQDLAAEDRAMIAGLIQEALAQATAWNSRAAELATIQQINDASRAAFRSSPRTVTVYLWNPTPTQP